jgi:hypothetical protein
VPLSAGDANDGVVTLRQKLALLGLGVFVSLFVCLVKSDDRSRFGCADLSPEAAAPFRACDLETIAPSTIFNFTRISLREAHGLEGKRIIAQLQIASKPMAADDAHVLYNCRSADHLVRSLCFPKDRVPDSANVDSELTVSGQLQIRFHNSWTMNGQVIPAYFELRLIDAEVVKH